MSNELKGKRFLQLIDEAFEDLELWYPVIRMREAGAEVIVAGRESNRTFHGKYGLPAESDVSFSEVNPAEFDGVLIPGGWAPDKLRRYAEVLDIVRHMDSEDKVIGQICHAGWVLASADVLKNRKVTSVPAIRDDLVNAGAEWVDENIVTDGMMVSAQGPKDLPGYMSELIRVSSGKKSHSMA
jgi:protease I